MHIYINRVMYYVIRQAMPLAKLPVSLHCAPGRTTLIPTLCPWQIYPYPFTVPLAEISVSQLSARSANNNNSNNRIRSLSGRLDSFSKYLQEGGRKVKYIFITFIIETIIFGHSDQMICLFWTFDVHVSWIPCSIYGSIR